MKGIMFFLLSFAVVAQAQTRKPCEELKDEIAAKLDVKGVQNYTLEIVPVDQITDKQIVGRCDGGTMKITYTREYLLAVR